MGQKAFVAALNRHPLIGVDSVAFIYHIEEHSVYVGLTDILFKHIESGRPRAISSALTLTEVLTLPYRKSQPTVARSYRGLLTEFPHLTLLPLDHATAELAASLRAHYNLSTPDAIQIGTALRAGATGFLTNDAELARVKELDVLLLNTYL